MTKMHIIILIVFTTIFLNIPRAYGELGEKLLLDALEYLATGNSKKAIVKATVTDCETNEPLLGAQVELRYHKEVDLSKGRGGTLGSCSGETKGATDEKGKVKLELVVKGCPYAFIGVKDEHLDISIYASGYEGRGAEVNGNRVNICLEKAAWKSLNPPIKIDYPNYKIDLLRFKNIFDRIKEINRRNNITDKYQKESYVVQRYYYYGSNGFSDFIEKIGQTSDINSISLIQEILNNSYPLPYKRVKYRDDESWRADNYVYRLGRQAAAKALLNISDDRLNELLPKAVDIPEEYNEILKEAGILPSPEDYWKYLEGKYSSRVHNPLIDMPPRPDPLILTISKLKEKLTLREYVLYLVRLYQKAYTLSKNSERQHFWKADRDRLATELFKFKSPGFISEVKKILPEMDVNDMTRKYILYLYNANEYDFLAENITGKKKLMGAFLGLDIVDQRKDPPRYYYREQEKEEKKSLIAKMPKVTKRIKNKIKHFLKKESKKGHSYYSWWIQNLAAIDRKEAEKLSKDLYSKATDKYEKESILKGSAESKLINLCSNVYDDLKIKDKLKSDYFSAGPYRIMYLNSSCPSQMHEFIAGFDANFLKEKEKDRYFEPNYGYGMDFRQSIWESIIKYFPLNKVKQIICPDIKGESAIHYLNRPPIKCVCEAAENYLSSRKVVSGRSYTYIDDGVIKYLKACYPDKEDEYKKLSMPVVDGEISERSYKGLEYIIKGERHVVSEIPLWDERYRAFFLGSSAESIKLKGHIDWAHGISSEKAFSLLTQVLNSNEEEMHQAALYAYSFYPAKLTNEIIGNLRNYASQDKFPEYLYAAYSISISDPSDLTIRTVCTKSAKYHINEIDSRSLSRSESIFAFNLLLTLQICGATKDDKNYLKLLELILQHRNIGQYDTFKDDLERIISLTDISLQNLIVKIFQSDDPINIIIALRLAELKRYSLDPERLKILIEHDDSYVRLAVVKYIISQKEQFWDILRMLKKNTNRRVRNLVKSIY